MKRIIICAGLFAAGCSQSVDVDYERLEVALSQSDDAEQFSEVFRSEAEGLILAGRCTVEDFEAVGGWLKSSNRPQSYFTYCGEMTADGQIYITVEEGR